MVWFQGASFAHTQQKRIEDTHTHKERRCAIERERDKKTEPRSAIKLNNEKLRAKQGKENQEKKRGGNTHTNTRERISNLK